MKNNLHFADIHATVSGNQVTVTSGSTYTTEFMGADFSQIVDDDLLIHRPLNDCVVNLSFRVTDKKSGNRFETDIPVFIPGEYGDKKDRKPDIVPEPAQWKAFGNGVLVLKDVEAIVCSNGAENAVGLFARDCRRFLKRSLPVYHDESKNCVSVNFSLNKALSYLGEEGYTAVCDPKTGLKLQSCSEKGLIWAGRTALQLLAGNGFPGGVMKDYPRYPVRGFMLDVARRPFSMQALYDIVDFMSWFKMNDFHVHLNDNYIWLEDYAQKGDSSTFGAYEAFRLESGLVNEKGESPTAEDYHYTKEQFRAFIEYAASKGVNIVPEIDVPAHALSFTKVFPEYMVSGKVSPLMDKRPLTDHLDISRRESIEYVKRIFDEYTKSQDAVFAPNNAVHLGADEFLSDYTAYRRFFNEIVPYIKKSNPVRLWGGLTWIKDDPETPIGREAIENVQMNLWSADWADGLEMYKMGFELINTIDSYLYMVPDGSGSRGSYKDFLNKRKVFRKFFPNRVKVKKGGKYIELPQGNKQLLGAAFALWNDNIDKRASGLTEKDLFERFADSAPLIAEKTWGSCTQKHSVKQLDKSAAKVSFPLVSGDNDFTFVLDTEKCTSYGNVGTGSAVELKGGSGYVNTGLKCVPVGSVLELDIMLLKDSAGCVIMESDAPYGTYDIRITENGKLGFTREGYVYEFDYSLPVGKRVALRMETTSQKTVLRTGFIRKKAVGQFVYNRVVRCSGIKNSTFSIPCSRLGSERNAVCAKIYSLRIKNSNK